MKTKKTRKRTVSVKHGFHAIVSLDQNGVRNLDDTWDSEIGNKTNIISIFNGPTNLTSDISQ